MKEGEERVTKEAKSPGQQSVFPLGPNEGPQENDPPWLQWLKSVLQGGWFQYGIMGLIVLNAITLGLDTFPGIRTRHGPLIDMLDMALLFIFVGELALRIFAYRLGFFRNGWNIFDFLVIVISALSLSPLFAALRAFRVLRLLHLISIMPRMRVVVSSLIDAIPGIMSVGIVVILVVYVFAIIASNLYAETNPDRFGDVFTTMYTLFQVMTLEGWAEIAAEVAQFHSHSWIFFISFVLVGTFTMLNLFVAIIVRVVEEDSEETEDLLVSETDQLREEIRLLRRDIKEMADHLNVPEAKD